MSTIRLDERRPAASTTPSADRLIAALLLVLAFSFLAAHLWDLQSAVGQFAKYPEAARRFLEGGIDSERLLDYSPLYLGLCVLNAKHLHGDFRILFWFQIFLVALTSAGLFLLLRRHFGRVVSLCGAAAFVLNPGIMIYSGIFEPEPLMMALVVLLLLLVGNTSLPASFAAGAVLVLCVFTRPTYFLLAPLIPVHIWMNVDRRRRAAAIALFLLPIAGGLALIAARVSSSYGSFPPPLMDPGPHFFMGNNPLASSTTPEYPPLVSELVAEFPGEIDYHHAVYRLLARRESPAPLTQAETNRFWASRAMSFARDEPAHFLAQMGRKALVMFHSHRWHDLKEGHNADRFLTGRWRAFVPMSLVTSLAILGLAAGLRRWRSHFVYYAAFASLVAAMLSTYTAVERLRLSLLPLLVVFAAGGLDWSFRERRPRLVALAILLPLLLLFSRESDLMRDNSRIWDNYVRQGQLQEETYRLRTMLDLPGAAKALGQSYAAAPWLEPFGIRPAGLPLPPEGLAGLALREFPAVRGDDPTARFERAILMIEAGDLDGAERSMILLRREGRAFNRMINRPAQPAYYLGRIAALRGRRPEAITFLEEALTQAPGDPAILARLAVLTRNAGYAAKLSRYFGELNALYFMALAHSENGDAQRAASLYRRLTDALPEYWKGKILLAAALADCGHDEGAVAAYLDAMQTRFEPVLFPEKIVPAFRRRAERSGADDVAWFQYALVLRQAGNYLEARRVLRRLPAVASNPYFRRELAVVEETIGRAGLR